MTPQELRKRAEQAVSQWDNHDRYRSIEGEGAEEPFWVTLSRVLLNILDGKPDGSHEFIGGFCVNCGLCGGMRLSLPCDRRLDGRFESCCECGEEYPARDSVAGYVFCPKCRLEKK